MALGEAYKIYLIHNLVDFSSEGGRITQKHAGQKENETKVE